jgi:antitoxin CcdA
MADLYDLAAPKKATNLSLNSDLLEKSKALKINLSATMEQALKEKLKAAEAEAWKRENKVAVEAYNDFVAEHGCLSEEYKEF